MTLVYFIYHSLRSGYFYDGKGSAGRSGMLHHNERYVNIVNYDRWVA